MIVTVSLTRESGIGDQHMHYSIAFGPIDEIPLPTVEQLKKAVYPALAAVADKAIAEKWMA